MLHQHSFLVGTRREYSVEYVDLGGSSCPNYFVRLNFDENSVETVNGLDDLEISDESVDEDCDVEKLEAGTNPLDFTKVLVAPPAEYNQERSIGSCLLEFTAEERLAGSNAYECEKCCSPRNKKVDAKGAQKKLVEALKRYLIYEPPVVLTLHLKRFHQLRGMMGLYNALLRLNDSFVFGKFIKIFFSYSGRPSTRKLGGHVSFPICFDIAPFCCKNVERISPGQKRVLYSLYGVVVHSGDLSGGHYIAYVKSRKRITQALKFLECSRASCADALSSAVVAQLDTVPKDDSVVPDGQWYYCSDNRVTAVPESRVLSAEAYILFYERVL
uniref:USP domain-containing protein n=1 Tax=Heterorhabditis bacteriophora TaxID=37862 RepID=A0A1I7XU89_HETBA